MEEIAYLYVDAIYQNLHEAGQVQDAGVLIAPGITTKGKRQFLGVSASLREQ